MIKKILIMTLGNAAAVYLAKLIISGFYVPSCVYSLLIIGLTLTTLNLVVKPFLKLIFIPVIWLTFGLFTLVINMGILSILDFLRKDVIIDGLIPLALGTILISFINLICQRLLLSKS